MNLLPPLNQISYLVDHIFLPPKISSISDTEEISRPAEQYLIKFLACQTKSYDRPRVHDLAGAVAQKDVWARIEDMFRRYDRLLDTPALTNYNIVTELDSLVASEVLPIQLRAQNAVLILRRQSAEVVVECFEALPDAASVIKAAGSLVRRFPAHAVALPLDVFDDVEFKREFAHRLSQLDGEVVREMIPEMNGGKSIGTLRDTANPHLVTEMLMATLAALGKPVRVLQLKKRYRDDAIFNNTAAPWRRSTVWLTARIAIQTTLMGHMTFEEARVAYKNFMLWIIVKFASRISIINLSSDICQIIIAKIARRSSKLGTVVSNAIQDEALQVCRSFKTKQDNEWRALRTEDADRPTRIEERDFEGDTALTLDASRQYLDEIPYLDSEEPPMHAPFVPNCVNWLAWAHANNGLPSIIEIKAMDKQEAMFALAELERWISHSIMDWLEQRLESLALKHSVAEDCSALAELAAVYREIALPIYQGDPEQLSIMYLNILGLWHALDRLAVNAIPLLGEFDPAIPLDMFESLLLPKSCQMRRLREVELHIEGREAAIDPSNPPIFSDPTKKSFAAQYYVKHTRLGRLRKTIEADATTKREAKRQEWKESSAKWYRLKECAKVALCEDDQYAEDTQHDVSSCKKCQLDLEADSMTIDTHEWPLPDTAAVCASVMLELDCPIELAAWRNLTWMILQDLGREGKDHGEHGATVLNCYDGLKEYVKDTGSRLTLASRTKCTGQQLKFPITSFDICLVGNSMTYRLFDSHQRCWIGEQREDPSLASSCITPLPVGRYSNLQYAVDTANHSQNEVIADQVSCSKDLSLCEFISFGSLRADGERVQWHNIKRELSASNLSLNTEEVCTLITQTAWQVGSRADSLSRNSHLDLEDAGFCQELLASISAVLHGIKGNWKSDYVMLLVIVITLRILSLCIDPVVVDKAVSLLHNMRVETYKWIKPIASILHLPTDDEQQRSKIQERILRTAAICKMTFDVDDSYIRKVLATDEDLEIWIVCSIRVRENTFGNDEILAQDTRRLLLRERRLTHMLHKTVRRLIMETDGAGLEHAIARVLSSFRRGSRPWTMREVPNDRWLMAETAPSNGAVQDVEYNILEGDLLIDGKPWGKLPIEYLRSDIYIKLLGNQILHCTKTRMSDMLYQATQPLEGNQIYFTKRNDNVVIRALKDSQIFEAIPQLAFDGDLPYSFVHDCVHWLNVATKEIEFRPLSKKWQRGGAYWRLQYKPRSISQMMLGDQSLVDVRSATSLAAFKVFGALDTHEHIQVTLRRPEQLEIRLPRYDLCFFLIKGVLHCRELQRIVDSDQSVGAMIGLESRLVLCRARTHSQEHDRLLLIPEGKIDIAPHKSHVKISITVGGPRIRLFQYKFDAILGRLIEDRDLYSTLYKIYLHALTSHTLPDPLTERTGTEEAISYLQQRSLGFSKPADPKSITLLTAISTLAPTRYFHPLKRHFMQRVQWHPHLSMLAQHDMFLPLAKQILESGDAYVVFHPDTKRAPDLNKSRDLKLLNRAKTHNSRWYGIEIAGEITANASDVIYKGRDSYKTLTRGHKSFEIASLVKAWPRRSPVSNSLWKDLSHSGTITGMGTSLDSRKPLSDLLEATISCYWGPLLGLCRSSTQAADTYHLLFLFSTLAYGKAAEMLLQLRTLLAFAFVPKLRQIVMPLNHSRFCPEMGSVFDSEALISVLRKNMKEFGGKNKRKEPDAWRKANLKHSIQCDEQITAVVRAFEGQWPTSEPDVPPRRLSKYLRWDAAIPEVLGLFSLWTANEAYENAFKDVEQILKATHDSSDTPEYGPGTWHLQETMPDIQQSGGYSTSLQNLLSQNVPTALAKTNDFKIPRERKLVQANIELRTLLEHLDQQAYGGNPNTANTTRSRFRDDLLKSYDAFCAYEEPSNPSKLPCADIEIMANLETCRYHVDEILESIRNVIGPSRSAAPQMLALGGLWPKLTKRTLLALLSTTLPDFPTGPWMTYLLYFGKAITMLQRARRLLLAAESKDVSTFSMELENEGHVGWDTSVFPDWLLMEIEGDFLIRPIQAQVAIQMIQPTSSANSLIQLNMGEGKSSVIVPLVAVALANGTLLSRVIVLKSLVRQMNDTMIQRLGGLLDRQIFFLPFSRKMKIDLEFISQVQSLFKSCVNQRGILLAQPEHVLSFKLMGIERLTSGDLAIGCPLLESQRWLESNVRDILDESDELLDVKFQLIYTIGSQRMMDAQPDRWRTIQHLFDLVKKHVSGLSVEHPHLIEVSYNSKSSFPRLRILSADVGKDLVRRLTQDILDGKLPNLSFRFFSSSVKETVARFLQEPEVSRGDCAVFKESFGNRLGMMQRLLLLRGYFVYHILLFVLRSKRWSVNYGLDPSRSFSAVPYRAKGIPAPNAEFGHPDVAVALTCLSYYYTGLTDGQIRKALELLQKEDDPSQEYSTWIEGCEDLPEGLRSWSAVNLDDDRLCLEDLFPSLRYGKKVADYYMAKVVFPHDGKEFDEILSTSGWDIVSKHGEHITTGFSGTNDNRFLLPLTISQQDLGDLRHTSGKVLDYLVRKENLSYFCAQDEQGRQLTTEGLIWRLNNIDPSVRVLIDVGAQVLDTTNCEFVNLWMNACPDADAGVFFDEDDNIMVLTRDHRIEELSASSFQDRLERCVVYIDEVHTRGTDLRLPPTVRAAVTLGPRLSKDRLVQACMRLRKLGQGHSLLFLAPPEVHVKIAKLSQKNEPTDLDGYDVVRWALEQSCRSIERSQSLRVIQGLNHYRREAVYARFSEAYPDLDLLAKANDASATVISDFREQEEQRLNDLYAPVSLKTNVNPSIIESHQGSENPMVQKLLEIWEGMTRIVRNDASIHTEHEREIAHEVEQETQIERPAKISALPRSIDPLLADFVETGELALLLKFPLAYDNVVLSTSPKLVANFHPWIHLRATDDFATTVEKPLTGFYDSYLRPGNWILTSKAEVEAGTLLMISQYEANRFIRDIQDPSSRVRFHMYEPRVTKAMRSVDYGLDPPPPSMDEWQVMTSSLRRELNLFGGQLYFNNLKDYKKLSKALGPSLNPSVELTLSFVRAWIALRRKGQDFSGTHLGKMVDGKVLTEEDFR